MFEENERDVITIDPIEDENMIIIPVAEEPPAPPKPVEGRVVKCIKLNVRKQPKPNAAIICAIEKDTVVQIDEEGSTDTFYKVVLHTGTEGYCVKQFIAKL